MLKILIVDDDLINRKVLEYIVRPYGKVTTAPDGVQAVRAFKDNLEATGKSFNLVLLDVIMPRMDGQLAMKKMRVLEKKNGIKPARSAFIIMATSMDMPTDQVHSYRNYGCDDYLLKPITTKKLLTVLNKNHLIPKDDT